MRKRPGEAAFWVTVYLLLVVLPLAAVLAGPLPPPRSFAVEFGVGLGFVGLSMLALQFLLTARFRNVAASFGLDTLLQVHRQAGLAAFGLVVAHVLVLFAADPAFLAFLDPRVNLPRAGALAAVLVALPLVTVLTLWRERLRIAYEWWRLSHGMLAAAVVFIGLVHVLQVGHYVSVPWKQGLWTGLTGAALLLLVYSRLVRPLALRNRPWEVTGVRPEGPGVWTLVVEARGHDGMRFHPGQFAWLVLGGSPFSIAEHPFSVASSAEQRRRLEFTIKELGDMTSRIGETEVGTTVFLEGPFGALTVDPDARGPVALVAGGIGITPIMSILRTLRDRGDRRPVTLVYGSPREEEILFRDELAAMTGAMDLEVVHVLEDPPAGWEGESGRITPDLLERRLPWSDLTGYLICGPDPMMDVVEETLRDREVSVFRIRSERFNIA